MGFSRDMANQPTTVKGSSSEHRGWSCAERCAGGREATAGGELFVLRRTFKTNHEKMDALIRIYILRIIWAAAFVVPFFVLPFGWAIFAILWIAVVGMIGQAILYAVIKRWVDKKDQIYRDYVSGVCEAIADIILLSLLIIKAGAPRAILPTVAALYVVNQVNRTYRKIKTDESEMHEMLGYMGVFAIYLVIFLIKNQ